MTGPAEGGRRYPGYQGRELRRPPGRHVAPGESAILPGVVHGAEAPQQIADTTQVLAADGGVEVVNGPAPQQESRHTLTLLLVEAGTGGEQGRTPLVVGALQVGAVADQEAGELDLAVVGRLMQRGQAL